MSEFKIAILGCTGHVGKNLTYYFGKEQENYQLFLFTRHDTTYTSDNLTHFCELKNNFEVCNYNEFSDSNYDVVINCVGISDTAKIESEGISILKLTEDIDSMILENIQKNTNIKFINFSSGAVYGEEIDSPIKDSTLPKNSSNDISSYASAKIESESRHREQDKLNIIDLRLFSFFSRFMDLDSRFLISDIIRSIKQNKTLVTNEFNFFRDYIHPKDLFSFLKKCIDKNPINEAFDLYSKKPIAKFDLLKSLQDKYGLQYEITANSGFSSPTGFKKNYYSESRKAKLLGYEPEYSSLATIENEMTYFLH